MLEVLSGADQRRVLELLERLMMGKVVLQALATGNVVLRNAPKPTTEDGPAPEAPEAKKPAKR
jgi:hypothetical protein